MNQATYKYMHTLGEEMTETEINNIILKDTLQKALIQFSMGGIAHAKLSRKTKTCMELVRDSLACAIESVETDMGDNPKDYPSYAQDANETVQ